MISIIGSGKVGSAVAFLICSQGLDDVVLVNRTKSKAIGEAMDLSNTIPKNSSITIEGTDEYSKTKNSQIVVITASAATYTNSRTEILNTQLKMLEQIKKNLEQFTPNSLIFMVSNPLDVLTYHFIKNSTFSAQKVIGIASSLDTSRFRLLIAKKIGVKASEISGALVLGEHGDSMVPIFSRTKYKKTPILDILSNNQIKEIKYELVNYWKTLREYKSRSVFGISKHVYDVIFSIKNRKQISIPSSVFLDGQYGESDVCIGVPTLIDHKGLVKVNTIKLSKDELNSLHYSADVVRTYIRSKLF